METPPLTAQTTAAPQPSNAVATDAVTTDFDTFLALLTAQLENQDPLKPVESTEFVAQLASFSAVEQQVATNTKLDQLVAAMGAGAEGLSTWIGLETEVASALPFDGAPITVRAKATPDADAAFLAVRDQSGAVIARQPIDPTSTEATWDGQVNGAAAPQGFYTFTFERFRDGEVLSEDPGRGFAQIVEARLENGDTVLVLDGGETLLANQVGTLRATR